jgi:hypothetical protein
MRRRGGWSKEVKETKKKKEVEERRLKVQS